MCIGFATNKIIAVYLGPTGVSILAQMQAFITMVSNVASAGVNNGIVKYTSEYRENDHKIKQLWSTALKISVLLIIPLAIVLVIFSEFISHKLLGNDGFSSILIIFSITLVFFVLNGFLLAILNGQKEIEKLTFLNIISSLVGLILAIILVVNFKLFGALLAAVLSQSVIFFITLIFVYKSKWFKLSYFLSKFDKELAVKLLNFSLMTFTSAVMGPVSQIYLRDYAGANFVGQRSVTGKEYGV
jgi:PST family polysaccharide transporter